MKAKTIKKLRKNIANFGEFEIYSSSGLFGLFYLYKENVLVTVKSDSFDGAMRRFLRYHLRRAKQKHKLHNFENYPNNSVTTEEWGRIAIKRKHDGIIEYYG